MPSAVASSLTVDYRIDNGRMVLSGNHREGAPMLDLSGYKLTFHDEFTTRSISQNGVGTRWADIRSEWRFDANSDIGFGRSSFVDAASGYDPFEVANGALTITAVPDRTPSGYPGSWESGLITTQGNFSQTYGYFEIRADFSDGRGAWDAFWLLPDHPAPNPNNLPGWQELDIVEHYGSYNIGTYRWIHTTDPGPNQNPNQDLQVFSNNPSQVSGFHTYGMLWGPDSIGFYFDGEFMGARPTPSDMHGPMYVLANLATQPDANDASVPLSMKIDYIRVYSNAADARGVPLSSQVENVSPADGRDPGVHGAVVEAFGYASSEPVVPFANDTGTFSLESIVALTGGVGIAPFAGFGGRGAPFDASLHALSVSAGGGPFEADHFQSVGQPATDWTMPHYDLV